MKRRYRLLADNLGNLRRWRVWDAVPLVVLGVVIYQGYSIKTMPPELGVFLIVTLGLSTLVCNPFGLLSWAIPPASRACISVGVVLVYGAVEVRYHLPESPLYPLAVAVSCGVGLFALGVKFRPRWLETWKQREERRRYQLSIFQCEEVDRTIGQLKAGSETAAVEAWDEYGCAQCRALLHQWAAVEISEDELDHIAFPVWLLAHGSAFTDRAELTEKYERKIEKLEDTLKEKTDKLYNIVMHGEDYQRKKAELAQERAEMQNQTAGLWDRLKGLQDKVKRLEGERDLLRDMVDELTAKPEEPEYTGHVLRMFPRAEPEPLEDVEELTDTADEQEPETPPMIFIAGVAVPVDLKPTQLRDLRILEYHEQDPKSHSSQNCADHFGLNSRKTADSALGRARKLRDKLRAEETEKAVNA